MAYHILQSLPQVSSDRVAVLGLSFGASVTLTLAAYSKTAKVSLAVCPILFLFLSLKRTLSLTHTMYFLTPLINTVFQKYSCSRKKVYSNPSWDPQMWDFKERFV